MTDEMKDQMDWENAEVVEGHRPGISITVRLDPNEAERLGKLASQLHLKMTQVMRQALAAYDPEPNGQEGER